MVEVRILGRHGEPWHEAPTRSLRAVEDDGDTIDATGTFNASAGTS
ncbi:MAG: hypothetical protein WD770_08360 [Actinomycetota bacterium]